MVLFDGLEYAPGVLVRIVCHPGQEGVGCKGRGYHKVATQYVC